MQTQESKWYYAEKGKRIGPKSLVEMQALAREGRIQKQTLVWNGAGDWKPAEQTELRSSIEKSVSDGPPPLKSEQVNNSLIWLVVAVPVLGALLEAVMGWEVVWWGYLAVNIVLLTWDEYRLKKASHAAPATWWIFLIPVYLWHRAKKLGQKPWYVWAWIAMFLFSFFIDFGAHQVQIEESAVPVVNEILVGEYGDYVATCVAVEIDSEVRDGFYRARAILDNGNDLTITIEEKGEQIFVRIPYGQ